MNTSLRVPYYTCSKVLCWQVLCRLEQVHGLSSRFVGRLRAFSWSEAACRHQSISMPCRKPEKEHDMASSLVHDGCIATQGQSAKQVPGKAEVVLKSNATSPNPKLNPSRRCFLFCFLHETKDGRTRGHPQPPLFGPHGGTASVKPLSLNLRTVVGGFCCSSGCCHDCSVYIYTHAHVFFVCTQLITINMGVLVTAIATATTTSTTTTTTNYY